MLHRKIPRNLYMGVILAIFCLHTRGSSETSNNISISKEWSIPVPTNEKYSLYHFTLNHKNILLIPVIYWDSNQVECHVVDINNPESFWTFQLPDCAYPYRIIGAEGDRLFIEFNYFPNANEFKKRYAIWAIDMSKKTVQWKQEFPGDISIHRSCLLEGMIYSVLSSKIVGVDVANGEIVYQEPIKVQKKLLVTGSTNILYGHNEKSIWAFDLDKHKMRWELNVSKHFQQIPFSALSFILLDQDSLYAGRSYAATKEKEGSVCIGVNCKTGQLLWKHPGARSWFDRNAAAVSDKALYLSYQILYKFKSEIVSLNKTNGKPIWVSKEMPNNFVELKFDNKYIYGMPNFFHTDYENLVRMDIATGDTLDFLNIKQAVEPSLYSSDLYAIEEGGVLAYPAQDKIKIHFLKW